MFVMNVSNFGTIFYLSVLSHEFRHMIEDNYDRGDQDWEVEGSAMLAEVLMGYGDQAIPRANLYLQNPDQQLTNWGESYTLPHYGQGYLLNRYLHARLGDDLYRVFAAKTADGFSALDQLATETGEPAFQGMNLWRDWLVAMALANESGVPPIYNFPDKNIQSPSMSDLTLNDTIADTVEQFGVDYYQIRGEGQVMLKFTGKTLVSTIGELPASGSAMWVADRRNYSQMRLTRMVDLSQLTTATLQYEVYHDLEAGYDFAYLSVSIDGGQTWQNLPAPNMQGADPADDPANAALMDRFYTGRSFGWQKEQVDLTPYAGKPILIRFEYVTDPILTHPGIAIDNIAIPEVHFYDSVETLAEGWQAEGFVRSTSYLPQDWQIQLITFPFGQQPQVHLLALENGVIELPLNLAESSGRGILIVSASTEMTLTPAEYSIGIMPAQSE